MKFSLSALALIASMAHADVLSFESGKYLKQNGRNLPRKDHAIPFIGTRSYIDFTSMSESNDKLQAIQDKYESYHLYGNLITHAHYLYIIGVMTGLIKSDYSSINAYIPHAVLLGGGLGFGLMAKNKIKYFSETYNSMQPKASQPQAALNLNYTWSF